MNNYDFQWREDIRKLEKEKIIDLLEKSNIQNAELVEKLKKEKREKETLKQLDLFKN